ncbi:hypothetical protein TBLA_0A06950 [Henningerozyma blattae CBS 6284]|uniref:Uncharacterized protein n=1 Tax=Henningerozyma blattae (strain ATCC 34711 / CBS 6284 / DSM 70876 / NBRC 10599 / NRRL Y-10934 / UCD 77-7) TaxID=1071380 RepID=I2GWI4_HENB6|nr:hypothetical protein TBLA_0A06950 [Tetrapisispora blattae CBS 6284]CCH58486.1 hypothetical protein TBLA_0A06950 [Tetrapisispora blattae CBS 6284]
MPLVEHGLQNFHLSHEEEDKLNQFQMITTFPEDELPLIIKLLQNHSWNLEAALGRYFDGTWKNNTLFETETPPPTMSTQFTEASPISSSPNIPASNIGAPEVPERVPSLMSSNRFSATPFILSQSNLIPRLPKVTALPSNFKSQKAQFLGINKGSATIWNFWNISHQNANTNNPLILVLILVPNFLFKLFSNVFGILWNILTFGFRNSLNTDKIKVFSTPKRPSPSDEIVPISEILPTLIEDETKLSRVTKLCVENETSKLEFNDALKICKDEFKYLLLILVGDMEPLKKKNADNQMGGTSSNNGLPVREMDVNSRKFISAVLSDTRSLDLLEEHKDEMIIYLRTIHDFEPWLVAKQLRVKYTPECILIGNVLSSTESLNGVTRASVLSRLRVSSVTRFCNSLKVTFDRFSPELVVSRTEMNELKLAREIKEAQNAAYEESLRQDQIKEHDRKVEQDKQLKQIRTIKLNNTMTELFWLKNTIKFLLEKEDVCTTTEKLATIQIRNSQGVRFIEKFSGNTTPLDIYITVGIRQYLKDFSKNKDNWLQLTRNKIRELSNDSDVLCFKDLKDFDSGEEKENNLNLEQLVKIIDKDWIKFEFELGQPYEVKLSFDLISPYPKYELPSSLNKELKEIPQLWPNGSLMIEEIGNEEEDESDIAGDVDRTSEKNNSED